MGSALYVSIQNKPSTLDTDMNGKPLAHAWEALDTISTELNIPNLDKLTTGAWKLPEKGLPVFQAYLNYVVEHPDSVPDSEGVKEDLKDVIRLLEEAARHQTKWRLMLDY